MAHQVGDVVNGHRLGPDNQWHPVDAPPAGQLAPPPPPSQPPTPGATAAPGPGGAAKKKPFYKPWWFILLALVVLFAIIKPATGGWLGAGS